MKLYILYSENPKTKQIWLSVLLFTWFTYMQRQLWQLRGQGIWCLMTKRSSPASAQPAEVYVPFPQCANGADWQSYQLVRENLYHPGQWKWTRVLAPLTEWLLTVLQRGSNIVPNSPQATCNLLRRLQHSPSITKECSWSALSMMEYNALSLPFCPDIFFFS